MDELAEYDALVAKVDAEVASISAKVASDLACRRGCSSCCEVSLTLSPVEAAAVRRALGPFPDNRAPSPSPFPNKRCVMLDDADGCAIYEARPLVCRTQGLPLSYPEGLVPVAAVRAKRAGREIVACHLNFTEREPTVALDAERVDALLAVVNRRFAQRRGIDPLGRESLADIATSAVGRTGNLD